jgi:L-fuculose-phosphate aldolase
MGDRRKYLIDRIVWVCQRLDRKGFGANHDGNVSARFEGALLATPTATSKGVIVPEMILTLDMEGKKIDGPGAPFSEIQLHLAAYRARSEIQAVVHAHPPVSTARGLVGEALRPCLPEAVVSIGDVIPVIPFVMPGARENEGAVAGALEETDAFMMQGNGVLAVGADVEQAYLRLELVEHVARVQYYAARMGKPFALAQGDVAALLEKRASIGLGPKAKREKTAPPGERKNPSIEAVRDIIAEEIRKVLQGSK